MSVGTIQILAKNGIHTSHLARQLATSDFNDFDYILAMDVWFHFPLTLLKSLRDRNCLLTVLFPRMKDANLRDITSDQPQGSKAKGKFTPHRAELVSASLILTLWILCPQ